MRANIFIRQENENKWKAIANKSEWINAILKNADDTSAWGKTVETPVGPAVTVLTDSLPEKPINEEKALQQFFLDYSDPSQKKPPHPIFGYPCCHNPTPCKHWTWSTEHAQWVNTLTGAWREE